MTPETDLLLILLIIGLPLLSSLYIKVVYGRNRKKQNESGMTGFDVARKILDENGLNNILILETSGNLSDHYDPTRKVVKLSSDIYNGATIASTAVAAHECGHAIQDKENYTFLRIRSKLVPVTNITSNIGYIFIVLGFILEYFDLLYIGVGLSSFSVLFQLITLPVEFNASHRAKLELKRLELVGSNETSKVMSVLKAAAFTYVAATLAIVLQLLRYILIINSRRD